MILTPRSSLRCASQAEEVGFWASALPAASAAKASAHAPFQIPRIPVSLFASVAMSYVRRPSASRGDAVAAFTLRLTERRLGTLDLEAQRAGDRIGLGQLELELHAGRVARAGLLALQR